MIPDFEAMFTTPTLSHAPTPRHQLSSCYIGSTPDNSEGILDASQEMARLSKCAGGIGSDSTQVRSIGSYIDGHKNGNDNTCNKFAHPFTFGKRKPAYGIGCKRI